MLDRADRGRFRGLPFRYLALSCAIAIVAAEALAAAVVAANEGYGAGDLRAFLVWLVPFGLLAGMVLSLTARLARAVRSALLAVLVVCTIGGALGYVWALGMAWMLGPWLGAFSFPIGPPLIAAGIASQLPVLRGLLAARR